MSDILKIIKERRSIRKFKNISINDKDLKDLIEAGIYAPSGSNTQCYRFIIITDKNDIKFLSKTKLKFIETAPSIILVVADLNKCDYLKFKRKDIFKYLPYQDCAMAMQNIILYAESINLSSCVIHLSEEWSTAKQIKKYFSLANNYELMGLIAIGYSDEVIDYNTAKHANRVIKRKDVNDYILNWRK
jgi:nitroreductase